MMQEGVRSRHFHVWRWRMVEELQQERTTAKPPTTVQVTTFIHVKLLNIFNVGPRHFNIFLAWHRWTISSRGCADEAGWLEQDLGTSRAVLLVTNQPL